MSLSDFNLVSAGQWALSVGGDEEARILIGASSDSNSFYYGIEYSRNGDERFGGWGGGPFETQEMAREAAQIALNDWLFDFEEKGDVFEGNETKAKEKQRI